MFGQAGPSCDRRIERQKAEKRDEILRLRKDPCYGSWPSHRISTTKRPWKYLYSSSEEATKELNESEQIWAKIKEENPFGYKKGIKTRAGESDIDYWTIDSQTRTSRAISLRHAIFLNGHWSEEKGVRRLRNGFHYQACQKKVEDQISKFNGAVDDLAIANPNPCPKVSLRRAKNSLMRRNYTEHSCLLWRQERLEREIHVQDV